MKTDLRKNLAGKHRKAKEGADHIKDGKLNPETNLGAKTV
jgi:hypothetical protein